jgi:hypothetical protein
VRTKPSSCPERLSRFHNFACNLVFCSIREHTILVCMLQI